MICPFCSLLCDAENLDAIQCDRRTASLVQFEALRFQKRDRIADWLKEAIQLLRSAKRILVMGRIASVESARAVVSFASKHNATIDCAESGHVFKNVLAIQRSGLNSVSLSEARDHSDFFIVIGNDSMMAAVPRMPFALSNGRPGQQTALLLGDFSSAATERWKSVGFDTWSVPCNLSAIPSALAQWSRWSDSTESKPSHEAYPTTQLFERLAKARYTTVVWSAETLQIDQADLWVERLLQWIASRNEENRCAALPWTSLDGTFQQVCTWLTGFPGRIAFRNGEPEYDPGRNSYEQWIARTPLGKAHESVVVLIDETVAAAPFWHPESMPVSDQCQVIELSSSSGKFPTAIAGVEVSANMFRADQTLLANVSPTRQLGPRTKPVSGWLEALSQ